jgi:uncharacterized protein
MIKADILKILSPIFRNNIEISAVYLFGSHAAQKAHAHSDVDLAILFESRLSKIDSYQRLERYLSRLGPALQSDFDLVDLEEINLFLLNEIITRGEIIIENNPERNREFLQLMMLPCIDFQWIAQQCAQGMYNYSINQKKPILEK